jgi:hypothetical protein
MLNSWQVNNNEEVSNSIAFNPVLPAGMGRQINLQNEATKSDYQKYLWLFGKPR